MVEQNCPYLDADGKDQKSYHVWAEEAGTVLAYTRIVKPGVSYPEVSIGRVVTAFAARRTGLGKELMQVCIDSIADLYGEVPIRISAQCYLEVFYQSFGFRTITEPYLEDDIPHVGMVRESGN